MLAGSDKQRKRKGVRGTSMINQNSINQAERRGCKIGMLYVCVTTSLKKISAGCSGWCAMLQEMFKQSKETD